MTAQWWQCTNIPRLQGRMRFTRQAQDRDLYLPRVMSGKPVLIIDAVPHALQDDPETECCMRYGNPPGRVAYFHVYCETPPPLGDWEPYTEDT